MLIRVKLILKSIFSETNPFYNGLLDITIKQKIMKTQFSTPTNKIAASFFSSLKNSKRAKWAINRNYSLEFHLNELIKCSLTNNQLSENEHVKLRAKNLSY